MSADTELEQDLPDDIRPQGIQILWGRILVLLLALALAFWLGTTFGGDSATLQRVDEQQSEIAMLQAQIAAMEAELAAVDAGGGQSEAAEGERQTEAATPAPGRDDGPNAGGTSNRARDAQASEPNRDERYVIQPGDSLASIAQQIYGDPTRWRDIARANDIAEPYSLSVGQTLRIPDAP